MSNSNIDNEIPGFKNYDKFLEGYSVFSDYFTDELKHIISKDDKYHGKKESISEYKKEHLSVVKALIKGAVALQFIGDRDFYCNNADLEVMIKFKTDYKNISKEEITFSLMKDVILLLEKEEQQLIRIANAYDQKE